jgi:hypothetical protein
MKIIEIKLEKKINGTVNGFKSEYDNETVSAHAVVEDGENVDTAMSNLRAFVESSLGITSSTTTMVEEKVEVSEKKAAEKPASKKKTAKKTTSKKKAAAKPKAKKAIAYNNADDGHKVVFSELADKCFTEAWREKGSDLRASVVKASKSLVGKDMFPGEADELNVNTVLESFETELKELVE